MIPIILSFLLGILQIAEYSDVNNKNKKLIQFFRIALLFTAIGYSTGKLF